MQKDIYYNIRKYQKKLENNPNNQIYKYKLKYYYDIVGGNRYELSNLDTNNPPTTFNFNNQTFTAIILTQCTDTKSKKEVYNKGDCIQNKKKVIYQIVGFYDNILHKKMPLQLLVLKENNNDNIIVADIKSIGNYKKIDCTQSAASPPSPAKSDASPAAPKPDATPATATATAITSPKKPEKQKKQKKPEKKTIKQLILNFTNKKQENKKITYYEDNGQITSIEFPKDKNIPLEKQTLKIGDKYKINIEGGKTLTIDSFFIDNNRLNLNYIFDGETQKIPKLIDFILIEDYKKIT